MPSPSKTSVRITAAQKRKLETRASEMANEALKIHAAGEMGLLQQSTSAGIPTGPGKGTTMIAAQRFRQNFYALPVKDLLSISRLMSERNWFVEPVNRSRFNIYGAGFRFSTKAARDWAETVGYDFQQAHDDLLWEYLYSSAAVALWLKTPDAQTIPRIEVPALTNVEIISEIGRSGIRITFPKNAKLDPEAKGRMGEAMFNAIKTGKPLSIYEDDDIWDFRVMKSGKSKDPFQAPSITAILDDLDFIECIKVGDWNGAWSRREIIRQTKKGYSTNSGPNAGRTTNNAKTADLKSILNNMKSIQGKYEMATNFDQDVSWITFLAEFFDKDIADSARSNLIHWGGLPAILMLRTESQISGISAPMLMRLREEVEGFRAMFARLLTSVFNSESFKRNYPDAPKLIPVWSVKPLYSVKELTDLLIPAMKGIMSPQTIRESFLGLDNEAESALMLQAHQSRDGYIPPHEANQGLLTARFPKDYLGVSQKANPSSGDSAPDTCAPGDNV
jgi:hypothetical protein